MEDDIINCSTWLLSFPGFFEAGLAYSNQENDVININAIRKEKGRSEIIEDDLNYDYNEYENEVAKKYCAALYALSKHLHFPCIKIIFFQGITRNVDYKFDFINIKVMVRPHMIHAYIYENINDFKCYLERKYMPIFEFGPIKYLAPTQRKFIDCCSYKFEDWKDSTKDFLYYPDGHYLGVLLDFIFKNICFYRSISYSEFMDNNIGEVDCTILNYSDLTK